MSRPDKREEIVRVALELIAKKGFHGAPIATIADRAAVAAGTIYNYFENKDVLIMELYQEIEDKFVTIIYQEYSTQKPIRDRYIYLGTGFIKYFTEHPLDFRYMEQFYNSPYGITYRRDKFMLKLHKNDFCKELFNDGISQHVIKNMPINVLFNLAFGPLIALVRDHILGFISLEDSLINNIVNACFDAIKL